MEIRISCWKSGNCFWIFLASFDNFFGAKDFEMTWQAMLRGVTKNSFDHSRVNRGSNSHFVCVCACVSLFITVTKGLFTLGYLFGCNQPSIRTLFRPQGPQTEGVFCSRHWHSMYLPSIHRSSSRPTELMVDFCWWPGGIGEQ